jgi:hypothetical protein
VATWHAFLVHLPISHQETKEACTLYYYNLSQRLYSPCVSDYHDLHLKHWTWPALSGRITVLCNWWWVWSLQDNQVRVQVHHRFTAVSRLQTLQAPGWFYGVCWRECLHPSVQPCLMPFHECFGTDAKLCLYSLALEYQQWSWVRSRLVLFTATPQQRAILHILNR